MSTPTRRHIEAVLVFFSIGTILLIASGTFGLTWDESSYFVFSDSIRDWFLHDRSFDAAVIHRYWDYNPDHNPHPPFMKILGAFFSHWLADSLPYPTGYRLANIVYVSACLALSYRLLASAFSSALSLTAIIFVCFQPRLFGHLLIAATDSPVAMSWLALTLIVWKLGKLSSPLKKYFLRGLMMVILGAAAATKITGFLVVLPLAAYLVTQKNFRELLWLTGAALFSLTLVVVVFPPDWSRPLAAIMNYLTYPLTRVQVPISTFYLGKSYPFHLPWHYFIVMTGITWPVVLFCLLGGLIFIKSLNHQGLLWAIACPILFWLLIVHLPATPRHDGIRQFVSIYPFLGLLAWLGLLSILARLKAGAHTALSVYTRRALPALSAVVLCLQTAAGHPFELSYYNELIGGIRGAEKKGMEMTYYLEAANQDFIRTISPYLDNGAVVLTWPNWPLLLESYARHGLLKGDFSAMFYGQPVQPDYLLSFRRLGSIDGRLYDTVRPLAEVSHQGVSLVKFSRLRDDTRGPSPAGH